jgi:membrane associated rhomboid family serine protease
LLPLRDNLPTSRFPLITILLIAVNIAVFGWQLTFSTDTSSTTELKRLGVSERDQNTIEYGAIPDRITHPGRDCAVGVVRSGSGRPRSDIVCENTDEYRQAKSSHFPFATLDEPPWWETIFTAMFMHGGWLHIAGNMLFLWVFGNNIEDAMGRLRFVFFYLLGGIAAFYAQALLDPSATEPTIGASGAISAVLGGYILLHPRARVLTLIFLIFFVTFIEVPAFILLGIWFALQALPAVGQLATPDVSASGGGVAYFAHVGGFLFGLATIKLFIAGRRLGRSPPTPAYE